MYQDENYTKAIQGMRCQTGARLGREGSYWSQDDLKELERMFYDGVDLTAICFYLQRTEMAVFQQILKMNLYNPITRRRKASQKKKCKCRCRGCLANQEECPRHLSLAQRQFPQETKQTKTTKTKQEEYHV